MAQILLQAVEGLFILVSVLSVVGWSWILRRRATTGQPLLEPRAQREPFWSLAEFFVCYGLLLICSVAAVLTAQRLLTDPSPSGLSAAGDEHLPMTSESLVASQIAASIAILLVFISMLVWMGLTRRKFFQRFGLWPSWDDLRLGLVGSLFIVPPVLWVAALLDELIKYKHPTLEAVAKQPTLAVFVAMSVSAVIVAPLFEEFMYRALLQGGAQKLARRLAIEQQALAAKEARPEISEMVSASEVATWTWWPLVISSAAFALMHIGQGAAPIALFLFAVGLGYLYRQSGRLWPCIVVHVVLNVFTMISFGLKIAAKGQ